MKTTFILHRSSYRDDPDDLMYVSKYLLVKLFLKSDLFNHTVTDYTVRHWGTARVMQFLEHGNKKAGRYLLEALEEWLDYWSREEQSNPSRDRNWEEDRDNQDLTSNQFYSLKRMSNKFPVELQNRCCIWTTVENYCEYEISDVICPLEMNTLDERRCLFGNVTEKENDDDELIKAFKQAPVTADSTDYFKREREEDPGSADFVKPGWDKASPRQIRDWKKITLMLKSSLLCLTNDKDDSTMYQLFNFVSKSELSPRPFMEQIPTTAVEQLGGKVRGTGESESFFVWSCTRKCPISTEEIQTNWRHYFVHKPTNKDSETVEFRDVCDLTLTWLKRNPPIFPGALDRIMMDIFEDELEDDPTIITSNELAVIMEMENAILVGAKRNDIRKDM